MKLWIRSQNKEVLSKVNALRIEKGEEYGEIEEGFDIVDETYRFGRYETKERALEVLDEIHNAILTNKVLELTVNKIPVDELDTEKASKLFKDIVYEMPKE